jgi:hypothetical protein
VLYSNALLFLINNLFSLKNLPFDTIDTDANDIDALESIYTMLKEKFNVGLPLDIDIELNQFEVFKNYPGASIGGTLLINHPEIGCYLLFIKVPTHIQNGRGPSINYYKYQVWAYATLRNDFGRVMIKRETLIERLLNVLHPVKLKIEGDAAFNQTFNVMANDKQKAAGSMTTDFINAIKAISLKDFVIEIVNTSFLIGSIQPITPQQTLELAMIASNFSATK